MALQDTLPFNINQEIKSVEEYKFDPIKGYPMLHWHGKKPFNSTHVNTGKTDPPSPFQIDPLKTDFKEALKKAL